MVNMRSLVLFGCIFLLFSADVLATVKPQTPIQNVVVLMLENRSFDHYVGYLKQTLNPNIDGLTGNEYNNYDPQNPNTPRVYVNNKSSLVTPNPGHQIPGKYTVIGALICLLTFRVTRSGPIFFTAAVIN
jgi:hypothetical protein